MIMMTTSFSRRGFTATEAAAPMRARPARGAIRAARGLRSVAGVVKMVNINIIITSILIAGEVCGI